MKRRDFGGRGRLNQPESHRQNRIVRPERRRGVLVNQRVRGVQRNLRLPFVPPEDWHEPTGCGKEYRIIKRYPGDGFRHVLTPAEVRNRLAQLPSHFLDGLEIVQFSRMTRKKQGFPCYGMQWGASLYLYPIENELAELYHCPPTPAQLNEARMYGGRWERISDDSWRLSWTEETIKDFYLNNILIHELGHLVDSRNTSYQDRERYAEWFATEYGYKRSSRPESTSAAVVRRHG